MSYGPCGNNEDHYGRLCDYCSGCRACCDCEESTAGAYTVHADEGLAEVMAGEAGEADEDESEAP